MGTHTHKAPYLAHTQGTLFGTIHKAPYWANYTRHPIGHNTQGTLSGTLHKAFYWAHTQGTHNTQGTIRTTPWSTAANRSTAQAHGKACSIK